MLDWSTKQWFSLNCWKDWTVLRFSASNGQVLRNSEKLAEWKVEVVNLNVKECWDLFNSTVQKYVGLLLNTTGKECYPREWLSHFGVTKGRKITATCQSSARVKMKWILLKSQTKFGKLCFRILNGMGREIPSCVVMWVLVHLWSWKQPYMT